MDARAVRAGDTIGSVAAELSASRRKRLLLDAGLSLGESPHDMDLKPFRTLPAAASSLATYAYGSDMCDRCNYGSSDDVEALVTPSATGGIDAKICSFTFHVIQHFSVHKSLIQTALFLIKRFEDAVACVKSMVPRQVGDMARRFCSPGSLNVCETRSASGNPNSESPNVVSELTESESKHDSNPDSYGKTSAIWIVSTAAPHHATGNRAHLSGFRTKYGDWFVHAVDETPRQVTAHGTVMTNAVTLPDVWFVPELTVNLVSVSQLVGLDYVVEFGSGMCYIRNDSDGMVIGKAHLKKCGMYVLDFLRVPITM